MYPAKLCRLKVGKDAEHLTGVARERLDIESVVYATVPLRAILPGCVPQERVADRRIGDLEITGHTEIARGDPIEDHAKCIEPPRAPCRTREACIHEFAELFNPRAELAFELGGCGRRIAFTETPLAKSLKRGAAPRSRAMLP